MPFSQPHNRENLTSQQYAVIALLAMRSGLSNGKHLPELGSLLTSSAGILPEPDLARKYAKLYRNYRQQENRNQAEKDLSRWAARGLHFVPYTDPRYPGMLRNIYEPPLALFMRGCLSDNPAWLPAVALVGSRRADQSGCEIARNLSVQIAGSGVCVISGLAYGIDAAAHRGAVSSVNGFPTVAVLGNGLSSVYPKQHLELAEQILARGGILMSQFEPEEKPYPSNFLNRNRLIAGLALGTIVVQATERSGALVTARYAMEEGREVFVVPGAIRDLRYQGSHKLIQQGASLITCAADVLSTLSLPIPSGTGGKKEDGPGQEIAPGSPLRSRLLSILRDRGQIHYDQLAQQLDFGKSLPEVLLSLELEGVLLRSPGNMIELTKSD